MGIFDFFTGSEPHQVVLPQYTGVQIQTSSNALPIPIVYGTNVIAPNILFAGHFQAEPIYGTGKHPTITGFNYTQNLIFGLCEGGPKGIARIGLCFNDGDVLTYGQILSGYSTGVLPPALPVGPSFVTATRRLAYAGTAYAYAHDYDLGISASTGSLNFEIHGILDASSGINTFDADPALMVQDFLTNPSYGVGLPASVLDLATLLSPATGQDSSYQGYCKAASLALSPAITSTEKANSILTRWLQLTNAAAVWSSGKLKIVPYGDTLISTDQRTIVLTQQIPAIDGDTTDGPSNPYIRVNAGFVSDGGVVNASTGKPLVKVASPSALQSGRYYLSTAVQGRYLFSTDDVNVLVTITFTEKPIVGFYPKLTPVYDLDDDDFVAETDSDPVVVTRSDPSQIGNVQRLEIADRNNFYSATTIEARDQNSIEVYGLRVGTTVTAHEITNAQTAQVVAQLILQRNLGIRNSYKFKLSWEHCLLEPMDVVSLTDAALGLARQPVRIVSIEEDDESLLSIVAEELVQGVGTAVFYGATGAVGAGGSTTAVPAPVTPLIYEPPAQLAGNQIELLFGATSLVNGDADANYGGCNVLVSYDNGATYAQIATFFGQSAVGVTGAELPAFVGPNPDTTDTLLVDLTDSGAALDPGSDAKAQNLETLVLVDGELLAYGAAAEQTTATYALTDLVRGAYGTAVADHAAGVVFFALMGPSGAAVLPNSTKGTTVLLKFQGFNVFMKGVQDLAACTPYPFRITGVGLAS